MIKPNILYIYSGLCGGPQACSGFPASANQIMPEHAAAEYQLNRQTSQVRMKYCNKTLTLFHPCSHRIPAQASSTKPHSLEWNTLTMLQPCSHRIPVQAQNLAV